MQSPEKRQSLKKIEVFQHFLDSPLPSIPMLNDNIQHMSSFKDDFTEKSKIQESEYIEDFENVVEQNYKAYVEQMRMKRKQRKKQLMYGYKENQLCSRKTDIKIRKESSQKVTGDYSCDLTDTKHKPITRQQNEIYTQNCITSYRDWGFCADVGPSDFIKGSRQESQSRSEIFNEKEFTFNNLILNLKKGNIKNLKEFNLKNKINTWHTFGEIITDSSSSSFENSLSSQLFTPQTKKNNSPKLNNLLDKIKKKNVKNIISGLNTELDYSYLIKTIFITSKKNLTIIRDYKVDHSMLNFTLKKFKNKLLNQISKENIEYSSSFLEFFGYQENCQLKSVNQKILWLTNKPEIIETSFNKNFIFRIKNEKNKIEQFKIFCKSEKTFGQLIKKLSKKLAYLNINDFEFQEFEVPEAEEFPSCMLTSRLPDLMKNINCPQLALSPVCKSKTLCYDRFNLEKYSTNPSKLCKLQDILSAFILKRGTNSNKLLTSTTQLSTLKSSIIDVMLKTVPSENCFPKIIKKSCVEDFCPCDLWINKEQYFQQIYLKYNSSRINFFKTILGNNESVLEIKIDEILSVKIKKRFFLIKAKYVISDLLFLNS